MRRENILISILLVLAVAMFGFGSKLGMRIQRVLAGPSLSLGSLGKIETVSQTIERYGTTKTTETSLTGVRAPVFSRYPFNLKNQILVAAGSKDGIEEGDVALYQGAILGTVAKVYKDSALVQTIFDSRFKSPVRVGVEGADALLVGGTQPRLTLIPAASNISNSDTVYSAAEGMPYGIGIGAISNLHDAPDSMFKDASLRLPYNSATLSEVFLVPKQK
jgi:cell shape-determining protein MreC